VLFVVALILRGQMLRRQTLQQEGQWVPWTRTLLPVVPMICLAALVTWIVQAQDLLWPALSTNERLTGTTAVLRAATGYSPESVPYGLIMPVWLLPLLVVLAIAAQLLYLDRVALRVGRPERDHPPRT
jgi:hypothetical protein